MDIYLRQYGVASSIDFELIDVTGANLKEDAADGGTDVTLMLDEAAPATATNDFTDEGFCYAIALTAAELTAARIAAKFQDTSTPKVYLDKTVVIETYGHPSSQHPNLGVPNGPQIIHMQLPYGKAATINFPLFDFATNGVQPAATFAAGDVKLGKDEGAEANIGTLPTDRGQTYSMPLTATELTCARAIIIIKDQTAPPLWRDLVIVIHTVGHPSAQVQDIGVPTGLFSRNVFGVGSTVSDLVMAAGEANLTNYIDKMYGMILDGVGALEPFVVHGFTDSGKHVTPLNNLPTGKAPASGDAYALFVLPQLSTELSQAQATRAEIDSNSTKLDLSVSSVSALISALRPKKNTALPVFPFFMALATDHVTGATGLTITAERMVNGVSFAACANAAVEVGAGWYVISLAASDLNADSVALKFTAVGADARNILIVTQP